MTANQFAYVVLSLFVLGGVFAIAATSHV